MYWSEWGNEPCIKKANMDGSNVVKITKGATGRPNSLTVDYVAQRLYWVDFDINSIMSSDVNGELFKLCACFRGEILFMSGLRSWTIFYRLRLLQKSPSPTPDFAALYNSYAHYC